MSENLVEKKVTISSSMSKKIIELLEGHEEEGLKIKYVKNTTPLNAVFQVFTSETDKNALTAKIKSVIKGSSFGAALYFSVTVE